MPHDVIVIGSGQAGVPLSKRLAAAGRRVVLVERGELGGTCVNTGCTPTKTLIASARAAQVARRAGRLGVNAGPVSVDLAAVVDRKDAVVERWRRGVRAGLEEAGPRLELRSGHARFTGPREIEVGGERLAAEVVVVNTGARPAVPDLPGLASVPWLDNRRVMELRQVPEHLAVLGGGYIGCELGQAFRRFGAEVTVVDHNPRLLARQDEDVSAALEAAFREEGIRLELSARVESVSGGAGEVALRLGGGREVRASHLLVAAGRRPNTDDLGCRAAGIDLDAQGYVRVDDRYRTSAPGVCAVGDVTGGPQFTHSSWDDHRLLYDLLTGRGERGRSSRTVPWAVFTDPQVAGVGLGEREARERKVPYEVATMPFGAVARAIETDELAGTMKVLLDPASERLLGARLVGAEAGELIHVFTTLMRAGAGAGAMVDAEFVHPTFAEGLQTLVMRLPRYALR
jgi:pyruvate/2-oxoglutarate dehydrogenase complex dihydrolipoamide dehydrogenase (E3) component